MSHPPPGQRKQSSSQRSPNHNSPLGLSDVNGGALFGGDASLPTSLPSYLPHGAEAFMNFNPAMFPQPVGAALSAPMPTRIDESHLQPNSKRQAPVGQWKTPPMFFYTKLGAAPGVAQPALVPGQTSMLEAMLAQGEDLESLLKKAEDPNFAALAQELHGMQALNLGGMTAGLPPGGIPGYHPGMVPMSSGFTPPTAQYASKLDQTMDAATLTGQQIGRDLSKRPVPANERTTLPAPAQGTKMPLLTLNPEIVKQMSGKAGMTGEMDEKTMQQIMQCPELLAIYQRLQEEDDRRRRRLARNRASARLRRLKKKTLVETFEQEVSQLEANLKRLQEYKWGMGTDEELVSALGEEKQPVSLPKETRRELTDNILSQHIDSAKYVQSENLESAVLAWFCGGASPGEDQESNWRRHVAQELHTILQLSPEQQADIAQYAEMIDRETRELSIVAKCLAALKSHEWLHFPQTEAAAESFKSAVLPHQVNKYTAWTEHNRQAIEALSITDASYTGSEEPFFYFGCSEDASARNQGEGEGEHSDS